MYLEGTVKSYNAERGFGFIAAKGQVQEIFFHIKDFPNKDRPPKIGEQLQFMIVEDQGRFKADCIERLDNNAAASKKKAAGQCIAAIWPISDILVNQAFDYCRFAGDCRCRL